MSVSSIKNHLSNNQDDIIKLLEQCDFYHISFNHNRNEIRCANHEDGNRTAVRINCETLSCISFTNDLSGDVVRLIQEHNGWDYRTTLSNIKEILGISFENSYTHNIFGGWYKGLDRTYTREKEEESYYPIEVLDEFLDIPNERFLNDNISLETQYKFRVGFDTSSNRITVPWFNQEGKLLGLTGRLNFNEIGEQAKWLQVVKFNKSNNLYGLYENYESIKEQGYVVICESEKSVMQLNSYRI